MRADAGTDAARSDAGPVVRTPPALRAYSGGTCPTLISGPNKETSLNTGFQSSGRAREFKLLVPTNYASSTDAWPLVFAWHWLNASADSWIDEGELITAAEQMRMIFIVPEELRDGDTRAYQTDWPVGQPLEPSDARPKELVFFDDMLTCVSQQFRIDPLRVYSAGVSAGGLFTTYLSTTDRAQYLAAIVSISGGLGRDPILGIWNMTYTAQPNKFPALIVSGGLTDNLLINDFQASSVRFRDALAGDGHFVVHCEHTEGHAVPPVERPGEGITRFRSFWRFLLDHPYSVVPPSSPYTSGGLNEDFPSWCRIVPTT